MLFRSMATIPNVGLGKLEARTGTAGQRTGNIEKEPLKCMAPADKAYRTMATYAAEHQVCIDLFLCVSSAVDVATLGVLPRLTGGSLYRYPGFNVQQDFAQLHNDLRWNFIRPQGLEAVMRVRASSGLGVQDYNGFFCKRTMTDIDLPAIDSDKTIAVTLRYEDKLVDGREAYVQCALLYSTTTMERRIRVHTIALPITSVLGALFRSADLDAQSDWAVRKAANALLSGNGTLASAKDASSTGTGCGPNSIHYVLGITKAYTTRVGEGPFPTELNDDIGELLGSRGKEFGTVTSRKRRCGWFDGVLVRQTIKISGIDGIALTKLDVLDELDEIKMCIDYELDGEKISYLPAALEDQLKIKPIYKVFPGWKTSTQGVKNIEGLPENAKNYIYALEDFIGTKISSISTSPEREDTILLINPFEN